MKNTIGLMNKKRFIFSFRLKDKSFYFFNVASYQLWESLLFLASSLCIFLMVAIFFIIKFPAIPTTIPAIIPAKDKIGKYNITVKERAIKLATASCPTLNRIPPVVLIPIKLTRLGPKSRINDIPKKLRREPAKLYMNVESVPPNKVVNNNLIPTTLKLSLKDSENIATKVTIFAKPIFAPGAKARTLGINPSNKEMTVA